MSVFRGEDPGGVVWQPRLEFWFRVNQKRGTLPERYRDATLLDLYDDIGASVRYFTNPLRIRYTNVKVRDERCEKRLIRYWQTPIGELREVLHYDEYELSAYHEEFRIKHPEDFRILEYILEDAEYWFDMDAYERDVERVGERGVPQFFYRRSPLQALIIEHAGFETTIYALADYPHIVEHYMDVAKRSDDRMYEVLLNSPVPILNFGENIDAHLDSPPLFRQYLLPYYQMRTEQIHRAGKFCHIHIDGAMKQLLPLLKECEWDGIEAATPMPQGDVTLEELKDAMGNMVLLDGIPAVYFLPHYPEEELIACVKRIVELFYPRLILGISDEIPPDGEIERVRLVSEVVKELIS